MVFSVLDRLLRWRPVFFARSATDSGWVSRMTFSNARFESLRTSATDFIEVNQIFGSPGFGLYLPLAMASARARICWWDMIPITIFFISLLCCANDSIRLSEKIL